MLDPMVHLAHREYRFAPNVEEGAFSPLGVFIEAFKKHEIVTPSERLSIMVWFSAQHASVVSDAARDHRLGLWVDDSLKSLRQGGGIQGTVIWASEHWTRIQDRETLFMECAELLNHDCGAAAYGRVRDRFRNHGISVPWQEIHDISVPFLATRLPTAIKSFDPLKGSGREERWLAAVFFRFALPFVLSDRAIRSHLEHLDSVTGTPKLVFYELPGASPEARRFLNSGRTNSELRHVLIAGLSSLPSTERVCIESYFGFKDEREHTLHELGNILGCSEYVARRTLLRGVARLCAMLGLPGVLTDQEFRFVELAFRENRDAASVGRALKLSQNEIRSLSARVFEKLHLGLRSRTRGTRLKHVSSEKEQKMNLLELTEVGELLLRTNKIPELRVNRAGGREVLLEGTWFPVSLIRSVASDQTFAKQLDQSGISVGWAFSPDAADLRKFKPSSVRLDNDTECSSWTSADSLFLLCQEEDAAQMEHLGERLKQDGETAETPTEVIQKILASLALGFRSVLDRKLLTSSGPRQNLELVIDRISDGCVRAAWRHAPAVVFEIEDMLSNRFERFEEWTPDSAEVVKRVLLREILSDNFSLPGFVRLKPIDVNCAVFRLDRDTLIDRVARTSV